ncbi:MAG: hypothetical protein L0220_20105 [Acidobacteria bacterium]|nr:hypothetical protein [Acidobacteriota bacterium]
MKKEIAIALLLTAILAVGIAFNSMSAPARDKFTISTGEHSAERSSQETHEPQLLEIKLSTEPQCLEGRENARAVTNVLPAGRMLIGLCDTLFMLDADRSALWEYRVPQMLIDFVFIPATGLIYGTAGDNNMFILEASSGRELVRNSRNGSAAFGLVKPYGNDMCLITDNFWGYRDKHKDLSINDGVTAWRGTEALWRVEMPPDADLIVAGNKIFALTNTRDVVFIKDIDVPRDK